MFTGLIEATGHVETVAPSPGGRALRVATALGAELRPGDSIAVSGVCLTVERADAHGFDVGVSPETLRVTTLGDMERGRLVNLERPLRADARLGGHFVLGHVDGTGEVTGIRTEGDYYWIDVTLPGPLAPCVIPKGSIAVDGISLTVASLSDVSFGLQIIPFTRNHTSLQAISLGDAVNLEVDVLGKYVVRLQELRQS